MISGDTGGRGVRLPVALRLGLFGSCGLHASKNLINSVSSETMAQPREILNPDFMLFALEQMKPGKVTMGGVGGWWRLTAVVSCIVSVAFLAPEISPVALFRSAFHRAPIILVLLLRCIG